MSSTAKARGDSPLLTVVTPSYNQAHFIRATIESILSQDYPHLEYLIMDGGSSDGTAAIAAEYSSRLTFVSQKDRGQAHAINKGFASARGEIVAWINSDDMLLPGAAARAIHAFSQTRPGIGAVYGEGRLMDRDGRITGRFPATEKFNLWKLTYLVDYILQQSAFFRRDAVNEVGGLDENLHYAMDWDLLIRLGKRFGLHYVPDFLGVLREYSETKTAAGGSARIAEIRRVLERHTGLRRAPGYWNYDLEMRRSHWKTGLLTAPLYYAAAIPLVLIHRHAQGLYRDGWASDRLKLMAPECANQAIVRGNLPAMPALARQRLAVWMEDKKVQSWEVAPGTFELRFPLPAGSGDALEFEIRAARFMRPPLGSELSLRRMAWQFEALEWE